MNEPCTRCPPLPSPVVRCGHLGEAWALIRDSVALPRLAVSSHDEGHVSCWTTWHPTRAEADAEFERREEALLA